jgi:hypothetical protein
VLILVVGIAWATRSPWALLGLLSAIPLWLWVSRARTSGRLELSEKSLRRIDPWGESEILVEFARPFGVTLLASTTTDLAWVGFTTKDRTALLRTSKSSLEGEAFVLVKEDLDARAAELSPEATHLLLDALRVREKTAFQKMYLTGSLGESIVLDGPMFSVAQTRFDLVQPFECRNFAFVERIGRVDGLYEATWLKQGGSEVVLVSSMGADVDTPVATPPPRNLRHAVDRAFYPPLLSVLGSRTKSARRPSSLS